MKKIIGGIKPTTEGDLDLKELALHGRNKFIVNTSYELNCHVNIHMYNPKWQYSVCGEFILP
jgi:hypothetical protein